MKLMQEIYPQSGGQTSMISTTALIGAIIGQLTFGALADRFGRRVIFITTCLLVTLGSLLSAFVFDSEAVSIYTWLALTRFLLGVGVGGEYPLSATVSSESSKASNRGRNTLAVFSMQGSFSSFERSSHRVCRCRCWLAAFSCGDFGATEYRRKHRIHMAFRSRIRCTAEHVRVLPTLEDGGNRAIPAQPIDGDVDAAGRLCALGGAGLSR